MQLSDSQKQQTKSKAPTVGIEPTTYGLEVHRAIRCAMRAYTIKIAVIKDNYDLMQTLLVLLLNSFSCIILAIKCYSFYF